MVNLYGRRWNGAECNPDLDLTDILLKVLSFSSNDLSSRLSDCFFFSDRPPNTDLKWGLPSRSIIFTPFAFNATSIRL